MNLAIAVMAKECLPGRVKTRLVPPLSARQAAALARVCLGQTLETVRSIPAARRLLVFDGTPEARDAAGFEVVPQVGGPLDERLAAVCALVRGPLLIIGMDTPQFLPADLAPMLRDWSAPAPRFGAWLGPAPDGGFWALGLRRPDPSLLRGVAMSTPYTALDQLERLAEEGLAVGMLRTLTDVDHFSDALSVARTCPGTRFARAVDMLAAGLASAEPPARSGARNRSRASASAAPRTAASP